MNLLSVALMLAGTSAIVAIEQHCFGDPTLLYRKSANFASGHESAIADLGDWVQPLLEFSGVLNNFNNLRLVCSVLFEIGQQIV
jgi:hypothetical protein